MAPEERSLTTTIIRRGLPLALIGVTCLALLRRAYDPLTNADTLFHLRFGNEFLSGAWRPWATGHIGSFEHNDWVPTQWLTEVVMAWFDHRFGLAGVTWLQGFLFILVAATMFVSARRQGNLLVAASLTPLAVLAMLPNFNMRPQVMSFLLMALTVAAWQRASASGRTPWLLIPLAWVWAMCHGMWPLGIAFGLAAAVGITLDTPGAERARTGSRLGAVPVLQLVAALCTPAGPKLVGAVLLVNGRSSYFSEWAPPDFTRAPQICLLLLLALAITAFLRSGPASWFDTLQLVAALGFSVYSSRTVPIAAICLLPLAIRALRPFVTPGEPASRRERIAVGATFGVAIGAFTLAIATLGVSGLTTPAWAGREISALPAGTPVLDDMEYGGYLMWKYPALDVTIHGYADVYTDDELREIVDMSKLQPGWERTVDDIGAKVAFLAPDAPLTYALENTLGWTPVHASKNLIMLRAPQS